MAKETLIRPYGWKQNLIFYFLLIMCFSRCSNLEDEKLEEFSNKVATLRISAYDTVFTTISKTQTLKIFPQFLNGFDQEIFLEETPKQVLYINDKVSKDYVIDCSEEKEYLVYLKVGHLKSNTLKVRIMDVNPTKYISRIEAVMGDSTFAPYAIEGYSKVDLTAKIYNYQGREFEPNYYPNFSIWLDGVEYSDPKDILIERTGSIPFYAVSGENISETNYLNARANSDVSNVYNLPVIFHLVDGPGEVPLNSESIHKVLEESNSHFRNQKNDFRKSHNAIASGIQFTLASTDTLGNELEEPGIHRIQTDINKFPYNDDVTKEFIFENLWDPEKYINVFVMRISGVEGFANYPMEGLEGTIPPINYNYMVSIQKYPQLRSTTLSHELGHFLGLRHIFGKNEHEPCADGDGFADTESYLRPGDNLTYSDPIYCNDIPFYSTNFMDYIGVRNSFTLDQVLKMREIVEKNVYLPEINSKGRKQWTPFVKGKLDLTVKAVE